MKKYLGILLAASPLLFYGSLCLLSSIFALIQIIIPQLSEINNPISGIAQGLWAITILFFPLGVVSTQYFKKCFKLWLIPINIVSLFLGCCTIGLTSEDEKGLYVMLGLSLYILVFSTIINIIFGIVHIIKRRNLPKNIPS